MNDNKSSNAVWWILGIIVVIVLIIVGVRAHEKSVANMAAMNAAQTSGTTSGDTSAIVPTEDVSAGSVHAGTTVATPGITYQEALVDYQNARIQFDASCNATPANDTWKSGTNVMLDNRSANTLNLHLGTIGNISIKPWGFKIVNLAGSPLPATVLIDCGANQNEATVLLQK